MASLIAIRAGLEANLQAADPTLQVYDRVPGDVIVPCVVVGMPLRIEYDVAIARGADRFEIPLRAYVSNTDYSSGQETLDGFADSKSATAIKTALESDKTLGGVAATLRVSDAQGFGEYTIGNVTYLGAEWVVEVITQ